MTANHSIFVKVLQCEHCFAEVIVVVFATGKIMFSSQHRPALRERRFNNSFSSKCTRGEHAGSWFCWRDGWAGHIERRRIRCCGFGTWNT